LNALSLSAEPAVATRQLNEAIEQASSAGGGSVVVPTGVHTIGCLFLRSNVALEIPAGAELLASDDIALFPALPIDEGTPPHLRKGKCETERRHFLIAEDAENIMICGEGTINGNVPAFTPGWADKPAFQWTGPALAFFRPTVTFLRCRNIRLRDVTIKDSPGWTCHLCLCDEVRVEGVQLLNHLYAGGSDGFDVNGCRDVWFSNCRIETGDDCIVMKSFPETRSCERIFISNCNLKTMCAAVKLGTESWHDFRQIHFTDSIVHGSSRAFQITCLDGATVEDIFVDGLLVDTNSGNVFNRPIQIELAQRPRTWLHGKEAQPPIGTIRRVSISNCDIRTDGRILLTAEADSRLEDIRLRDLRLRYPWIEPVQHIGDSDLLQGAGSCPEGREATAAFVAVRVDGLRVREAEIQWPQDRSTTAWLPKYRRGQMVTDPQENHSGAAYFAAAFQSELSDAIIDDLGPDYLAEPL